MVKTRADRHEAARVRRDLAVGVAAPAGDGPIGLHSAGVTPTRADRGEGASRRCGLAV